MEEEELYKKINDCVSKFKNGEERFQKSALFNGVVTMLVRGESPYEVIDRLCQINEDTQKEFEQYVKRDTRPMVLSQHP